MKWGNVAWRLIAIGVVVYFAFKVLQAISVVALSVVIALFLSSVLWGPVRRLNETGLPPILSTFIVVITALAVLVGVFMFIIPEVVDSFGDISEDVARTGEEIRNWLTTGPLDLSESQIDDLWDQGTSSLQDFGQGALLGGATAAVEFVTAIFLVIIITFFVLKDGKRMFGAFIDRLPERRADDFAASIRVAWHSLSAYMKGIALVGLVDAFFIGLGLWILGVPLVIPLSILVFFGAFFPLVGAFVTGLLAVAVAFVNGGITDALIVLALVTVVQQVEGDVVLPLVFGQTLRMHPLLILLAVAAGGLAFGLVGAFLSVPAIAVLIAVREELADDPESTYLNLARG